MSGFVEDFEDKLGGVGDDIEAFTGQAGADAAIEAAERQAALGREGLALTRETQARLEETLAPFVGVGTGLLDSGVFGPDAVAAISQDPAFQAALEQQQVQLLAQQAARGRLGTDETAGVLSGLTAQLGSDFLSRQRGDVLGGLQLGQASAAQQAAAGLTSGNRASDILTNIGNVTAAGGIGVQQAQAQGAQNVIGLATTLGSLLASERRFKEDIKLTGIRPDGVKIYTYRYAGGEKRYTGAMVDENPHAVVDCGTYKAIDYRKL